MFRNGHIVVLHIGKDCGWGTVSESALEGSVFLLSHGRLDRVDMKVEMQEPSVSEIGKRLTQAGRLKIRPLCVYGSQEIPEGVTPSTSVSSCVARAIFTLATRQETPPIYVAAGMSERCCPGGLAQFGFTEFDPGIKYFVSTGSKISGMALPNF